MSDSFADLWNASAPSKPTPPPPKLGSVTASNNNARRPQQDVFALLASSSAPTSRPLTPQHPRPTNGGGAGDVFSGLVPISVNVGPGKEMTMAERAKLADEERRKVAAQRPMQQKQPQESAWDGLDLLGGAVKIYPGAVNGKRREEETNLGGAKPALSNAEDDWGLSDFSSQPISNTPSPAPSRQPLAAASAKIWDLDGFAAAGLSPSQSPSPPPLPRRNTDSPGNDFNFGDREDGDALMTEGGETRDEDDILGVLSKPVHEVSKARVDRSTPVPTPPPRTPRAPSPPPHIVGQIVEMGFSPEQARVALAATDTGLDVQAALETLLSNGAGAAGYGHEMDAPRPPQPTRDTRRERASPSPENPVSTVQPENILAQASGIGLSVLSKANAFWASGKELALKAYEERAKTSAAAGSATQPVRPKWMQDGLDAAEGQSRLGRVDDGVPKTKEPGKSKPALPSRESKPRVPIASVSEPPAPAPDLFSDIPTAYVSPFRRSRPVPTVPPNEPSSSATSSRPPVLAQRKTISASPGAMAASDKHKASGTEKFKLGQYADAEIAYSAAMEVLPDGHLLLVPLYNNRALTRLKNGDYAGAVQDSTTAITLIGPSYNPALESKVVAVEDGAEVDLGEGLVKAWKRRAEAWEGREKWAEARRDWEAVAGCAWAKSGLRGEGVRGAGRCRRLIDGATTEPATRGVVQPRKVPSRPRPAPAPRIPPQAPSIAVTQFREAVDAQEAEDNARAELKDTVDAKLLAWKGGKETNIRALIASLDSVLWPELGLTKAGMGDLVSEKQVKIRYTKAIAKVHPDKLDKINTTLEQRMIANGVFGTLNEAWNAFRQ